MNARTDHYARALFRATKTATAKEADAAVGALCALLAKTRRSHMLPGIVKEYRALLLKRNALEQVKIQSAAPISHDIVKKALALLGLADDTPVKTEINPALLGGLVVSTPVRMYDLSLSGRLAALKERLVRA